MKTKHWKCFTYIMFGLLFTIFPFLSLLCVFVFVFASLTYIYMCFVFPPFISSDANRTLSRTR